MRRELYRIGSKGQSMVELLAILLAMLLLIMATIQFALIYHAKTTLNYAAYEAVRAGSLNNADFEAVKEGFARGMAPLYSYAEKGGDQIGTFQVAREKVLDEFKSKERLIRIERLSPSAKDFLDFSDDDQIPNDNLRFRSLEKGKSGNKTIQDVNVLHLRVTYWYPLYVPMAGPVIASTVCQQTKWKNDAACEGADRIPLTAVAAMRMQSPAKKSKGYCKSQKGLECDEKF